MKPLRFLHCADLHIDTPFKGIVSDDSDLAKLLYQATFESFKNIITTAIEQEVDFIVIAGDIFDSDSSRLQAQLRFRDGLKRLAEKDISAYIVYGNHDPLNSWSATLEWPKNIYRFLANDVTCLPVKKNGEVIAKIYGISFDKSDVTDNLAVKFPQANNDVPCIGLLHTNVGSNPIYEPYAPCSVADLTSKGMEYWALGHVHKFDVIKPSNPAIVYPGCSQSRQPNETGQKGCCLVTLTPGKDPDITFIPTDVVRYKQDSIDISQCTTIDNVINGIEQKCRDIAAEMEGRHCFIRLSLTGQTALYPELHRDNSIEDITQTIRESFSGEKPVIWLEKLILNTSGIYNLNSLRQGRDFISDIILTCDDLQNIQSPSRKDLEECLAPLFKNWTGRKYLKELSDEELNEFIDKARDQILNHLVKTD